jgi:hypothetical protein
MRQLQDSLLQTSSTSKTVFAVHRLLIPPDSIAIPWFLTTEKKISSVSGEDGNKPCTFAANNIDARVTLGLSSVPIYKDGAGLERQQGYGI